MRSFEGSLFRQTYPRPKEGNAQMHTPFQDGFCQ
jgi:hypothetical protein